MKLTLIAKKTELPGVESFIFKPEEPLTWKAGQYAHYILPHDPTDDRGTERWFTISSAPFEENVVITTRILIEKGSTFKTALTSLPFGESIQSDYVDGDFIIEDANQEYIFIAGGIGITPFHSILKEADHAGTKLNVTVIYANRDAHFVFKDELEVFAKNNPNLRIHYLISPERVDENAIKKFVSHIQKPIFYISGPEPMVQSLAEMVKGIGAPASHVKIDEFPGYPSEDASGV